jgi:hypothetical protein
MRNSNGIKCLLTSIMLTVLLAVMMPATASAQGRGHGRGHGRGGIFGSSHNKCGKFVNCHDARDGRIDGRGPRRNGLSTNLWRNRRNRIRTRNLSDNWVRNRRYRNHNRLR